MPPNDSRIHSSIFGGNHIFLGAGVRFSVRPSDSRLQSSIFGVNPVFLVPIKYFSVPK